MNANDINRGECRTGERKKRKKTSNQEPPRKRVKAGVLKTVMPMCACPDLFQTILDLLHKTQFRSSKFLDFLDDMLTLPSASHFSGAHHFVSNGGTFNNILGNYSVVMGESSDAG